MCRKEHGGEVAARGGKGLGEGVGEKGEGREATMRYPLKRNSKNPFMDQWGVLIYKSVSDLYVTLV